jgi:hypothetical protein
VEGLGSFVPTMTSKEINHISANYPFVALCWRGGGEFAVFSREMIDKYIEKIIVYNKKNIEIEWKV